MRVNVLPTDLRGWPLWPFLKGILFCCLSGGTSNGLRMCLRWMRLAGCGGSFKQVRDKPERDGRPNARAQMLPLRSGHSRGPPRLYHMCAYLYHSLVCYMNYRVRTCAYEQKLSYLCLSCADIELTASLSLGGGFSSSPYTASVLSSAAMPSKAWSTPIAFTASWSH